jgi:hypothetical protein
MMVWAGPTAGTLTTNPQTAVLGNRNMIQVGFISNVTAATIDIEIQFAGDGRGPLGATEFEATFGEPTTFAAVSGGPPVKVFAIGQQAQANPFSYQLNIARPTIAWPTVGQAGYNAWIAVYSANYAAIAVMGPSSIPVGTTDNDKALLSFIQTAVTVKVNPLYSDVAPPATWGTPNIDNSALWSAGGSWFGNTLLTALTQASGLAIPFLASGDSVGATVTATTVSNIQTALSAALLNNQNGGPIYVAWDSSLNYLFGASSVNSYGTYANQGQAILADRRDPCRTNILGFYLGPTSATTIPLGTNGIFLHQGLLTLPYAAFTPGQVYYLGLNGQLTAGISPALAYSDVLVKIGTAQTAYSLMVDPSVATQGRVSDYPIGALKPLPQGVNIAEYGFVLADGVTALYQYAYPALYAKLLTQYTNAALQGTGGVTFVVPALTHPLFGNFYQIKALDYGYQPIGDTVVANRYYGTLAASGAISLSGLDITAFASQGPLGVNETPMLDRVFPKLFVQLNSTGTAADWREVPPGYFSVGSTLYGYNWVINQGVVNGQPSYTVATDISGGSGIALLSSASTLVNLSGKNYRVVIYKADILARYSEFDIDLAQNTLSVLNPASGMPVNSTAVENWVNASINTNSLNVSANASFGTMGSAAIVTTHAGAIALATVANAPANWTINLDPTTGYIYSTATSGLGVPANSLITRATLSAHQAESITSVAGGQNTVHGIHQGFQGTYAAPNAGNFDAASLTGLYVSSSPATAPTQNTLGGTAAFIPYVNAGAAMSIGKAINMNTTNSGWTLGASIVVPQTNVVQLQGTSGTSPAALALVGAAGYNPVLLSNNAGTLELTTQSTSATTFSVGSPTGWAPIKALAFLTQSARSAKKDIEVLRESALDIINATEVVTFRYNAEDGDTLKHVGFIADDTHALMAGKAHDNMRIADTVGLLLRAVQELSNETKSLKAKLARTQKQLARTQKQ